MSALAGRIYELLRGLGKALPYLIPTLLAMVSETVGRKITETEFFSGKSFDLNFDQATKLAHGLMVQGYLQEEIFTPDIIVSSKEVALIRDKAIELFNRAFSAVEEDVGENAVAKGLGTPSSIATIKVVKNDALLLKRQFGSLNNARRVQLAFQTWNDETWNLAAEILEEF